jgi:predicted transcriptional regulator
MYRTNLSYKALGKYLAQLQSVKFLEIHHSMPRYATTQKGLEFLEKWQELQSLLSL